MVTQIEQVEQLQALQSLVKEYYTAAQTGKQMEDPTAYESRNLILLRFDRVLKHGIYSTIFGKDQAS
jgi:hypothetical protein